MKETTRPNDMSSSEFFFEGPALRVRQPLGTFYVISISAEKLLHLCYSDKAELSEDGFNITGTQRIEDEKRQREISDFIGTEEAAFPNSIILGANYDEEGNYIESEASWSVEGDEEGSLRLRIPSKLKMASIIDGQHRLRSFRYADPDRRINFDLICSVYLDLPIPYHAYLFSTINFNQRKVDKSLAYNLFGFDIEATDPKAWVPETLAVSIARRLNVEDGPFKGAVSLGVVGGGVDSQDFNVSMATIVDGLLKLYSKKPKSDRSKMMSIPKEKRDRKVLDGDGSPLRFLYRNGLDEVIYEVVTNYFVAVASIFWEDVAPGSYIKKTVGVQALFDVLLKLLDNFESNLDGEVADFVEKLAPAARAGLDFSRAQASGAGRTYIKNEILKTLDL
ncbi:DGQHR domain-containing protein [Pseudomonas fulva]|uniref:DGQHR domain-containing protein n=1 Tax=Pseudomonas fulva TaxID=47880 RepID=UPI00380A1009